ncbi:MAG: phenylalanine--tRNA ligase subunit beta [Clostridia bacterium]|jgi:phenylalanyl-tRNA synthetase beta chain|nr:phenylalanine--tRNA ligase subunit beta [Clostridia bacterium]
MLVPLSWLNDYVDIEGIEPKELADKMTLSGSAVETIDEKGKDVENVVVGKVVEIKKHPNADKLVVCQVNVGKEENIQICTGATNLVEGDYVPVALHGAKLPGGLIIKKGELRGLESNGMMCSIEELGFTREEYPDAVEDGIYVFNKKYDLGEDVKPIFGLDEVILEFELTSNRGDCNSIVGIAREVAAVLGKELKMPEADVNETAEIAEDYLKINNKATDKCSRYSARIIQDVKIGESPDWIKKALLSIGINPKNNVVDITNLMAFELGQPMHAFDLDKVEDHEIIIRNAENGEVITTLDEEVRELDDSMLVIADKNKALAIAGIMGGNSTKIDDNTKTVLLEVANFDATNIRVSSKKLGLRTDASAHYEKGIDPNLASFAADRAAMLIEMYASGKVAKGLVDSYDVVRKPVKMVYAPNRICKLLGIEISEDTMIEIFEKLGFIVNARDQIVEIPTHRDDISIQEDLAEEIIRIYGFDKLKETLPSGNVTMGIKTAEQKVQDEIVNKVLGYGYSEVRTYSFESPKSFEKLNMVETNDLRKVIEVTNPLGEDYSLMRRQLANGMLTVLSKNYNQRNKNVRMFEVAKVYNPVCEDVKCSELPNEDKHLSIGAYGDMDYYDLKGTIETLLEGLNIKYDFEAKTSIDYMHPGRTAAIISRNQEIGHIGEVHPLVLDNYDIKEKVYYAELNLDKLIDFKVKKFKLKPLPKYPAMNRDLAFLVKDEILVGDIEKIIRRNNPGFMEEYSLFDIYKGEQIEEGKKSVAYNFVFRSADRTLTDEEVNKAMDKIITELKANVNAEMRG